MQRPCLVRGLRSCCVMLFRRDHAPRPLDAGQRRLQAQSRRRQTTLWLSGLFAALMHLAHPVFNRDQSAGLLSFTLLIGG